MNKEFKYKVNDKFNNKFESTITAKNKSDALNVLTKKGFKVISLNEIKLNGFQKFINKHNSKKLSVNDKNSFFKQLYSYLKLGFNSRMAIDFISQNKILKVGIRNLAHNLLQDIDKGFSLGSLLHKYGFSKEIGEIVKSGEEIGNLKETIKLLVDKNELDLKVSKGLRSIFIFPAVLVPILLIVNILILIKLIPKFKSGMISIAGSYDKIPDSSKFVFYLSEHVMAFSIIMFGSIIGSIALFYFLFKFNKKFQMFISKKALSIPILGYFIYYKEMAQITAIMSLAYGAGYNNEDIIEVSKKQIKNFHIKSQFNMIHKLVKNNGYSISEAMILSSFDQSIYTLIQMGEINGRADVITNLNHLTGEFASMTIENLKQMENFKSTFNTLVLTIFTLPIIYFIMTPQIDQMKLALNRMH